MIHSHMKKKRNHIQTLHAPIPKIKYARKANKNRSLFKNPQRSSFRLSKFPRPIAREPEPRIFHSIFLGTLFFLFFFFVTARWPGYPPLFLASFPSISEDSPLISGARPACIIRASAKDWTLSGYRYYRRVVF